MEGPPKLPHLDVHVLDEFPARRVERVLLEFGHSQQQVPPMSLVTAWAT